MADKKVRVHNLAKELDVPSQVILDKCRAEGIELKNHMTVLSAGQEATIREWFSEGAHSTTLEETSRVDLPAVRVKTRRTRKADSAAGGEDSGVAVLDAPATPDEARPAAPKKPPRGKAPPAPAPAAEPPSAPDVVEAPPAPPETTLAPAAPTPAAAPPSPTPHARPAAPPATSPPPAVRPAARVDAPPPPPKPAVAGPQNIPKPAQLTGPRVVRIDKPDHVEIRRPPLRPTGRPPLGGPGALPGLPPIIDDDEHAGRRGPGGRGRAVPRDAVGEAKEKKPAARRGLNESREAVNEKLEEWREYDLEERRKKLEHASGGGITKLRANEARAPGRRTAGAPRPAAPLRKDKVELTEPITIKDFSRETGIAVAEILKKLMTEHGQMATINSAIETETARQLAAERQIELVVVKAKTGLDRLLEEYAALPRNRLAARPPVVTVLGHVDHGKTTLLDRIRAANVAAGEAGGITQHIGAYRVTVGDRQVTFLDTPGHTAFTAMRARGASLTDVVVLVVAADDGVMPTTVEAINHARAANTTIVVALNKIDLPHDLNKIYGQLAEQGLTPSGDWGGETDVIQVSALAGRGVDELLAHLATLSDVMELKADATLPASGTVIEAERSGGLGNVARVLVQEGTLKPGDVIVCGACHGRVRALKDDRGKALRQAPPSTPVEVTGLSDVPQAGDRFVVVDSPQRAKEIADEVAARRREESLVRVAAPTNLEAMLARAQEGEIPELRVIIRADVQGSVDVLKKALSDLPREEVRLDVMHAGVGNVTESDVVLAQASQAIIIAFHVAPDPQVKKLADGAGVDIREYRIIYQVIDDIRKALEGLLTPEEKVESRGRAEVREVFNISRVGRVAGSFVRDGSIMRNHMVRVLRDGVVIKDLAALDSLRRFKDDVKEVKAGFECGIRIGGFDDLKPGDIIEAFEVVKIARTLGA